VLATTAVEMLTRAYPNAELGMLLPSWARPAIDGHARLKWIHHVDHWKSSRLSESRFDKWRRHQRSAAQAIREIAAIDYDVAIDLYAYYPNFSRVLWKAGVPVRVGYASGGGGPLYTHALEWSPKAGHTASQHARLVAELVGHTPNGFTYDMPALRPESTGLGPLGSTGPLAGSGDSYIVVHPGTGDARKAWPDRNWHALVGALTANGERVAITGAGAHERAFAVALVKTYSSVINLVDTLDWSSFRAALAGARVAIGVDSVAMHLAAAAGVPTISISAAMSDPEFWRPLGEKVSVLTHAVPCAPCFRSAGCAAMACVRQVSVDDVLREYARLATPNGAETSSACAEMRVG
jgi:ADP-heptose:LPS heptosyltransferase